MSSRCKTYPRHFDGSATAAMQSRDLNAIKQRHLLCLSPRNSKYRGRFKPTWPPIPLEGSENHFQLPFQLPATNMPSSTNADRNTNSSQDDSIRFDKVIALMLFYQEIHAVRRHRLHQFYVHRAASWLGVEFGLRSESSDGLCALTIDWMEEEKDTVKMRMRSRGEEQEFDEGAVEELFHDLEEGWKEDEGSGDEEDEEF